MSAFDQKRTLALCPLCAHHGHSKLKPAYPEADSHSGGGAMSANDPEADIRCNEVSSLSGLSRMLNSVGLCRSCMRRPSHFARTASEASVEASQCCARGGRQRPGSREQLETGRDYCRIVERSALDHHRSRGDFETVADTGPACRTEFTGDLAAALPGPGEGAQFTRNAESRLRNPDA